MIFSLLWFFVFTLLLTPILGILTDGDLAGVMAIIGTIGGLFFLIVSLTILKKETSPQSLPDATSTGNHYLPNNKNQNALPPQQTYPAQDYTAPQVVNWRDTNELLQPQSVTENTTKLFKTES